MVKDNGPKANGVEFLGREANGETVAYAIVRNGHLLGNITATGGGWEVVSNRGDFVDGRFNDVESAKGYVLSSLAVKDEGETVVATEEKPKTASKTKAAPKPGKTKAAPKPAAEDSTLPQPCAECQSEDVHVSGDPSYRWECHNCGNKWNVRGASSKERERRDAEKEKIRRENQEKKDRLAAERDQKKRDREAAKAQREAEKAAREAELNPPLDGLVPGAVRKGAKIIRVSVADIEGIDGGDPVTEDMVKSVALHGIIQPPVVRQLEPAADGQQRYSVIAGKRRLQAARANGMKTVEAVLETRTPEQVNDAVTAIVENLARKPNIIDQHHDVMELLNAGMTPIQIQNATGMTKDQVRKARDVGRLIPELIAAAEDNRLGTWGAEHASRLTTEQQGELVKILEENGKITADDVRNFEKDTRAAQLKNLGPELTAPLPSVPFADSVEASKASPDQLARYARAQVSNALVALEAIESPDAAVQGVITSLLAALEGLPAEREESESGGDTYADDNTYGDAEEYEPMPDDTDIDDSEDDGAETDEDPF